MSVKNNFNQKRESVPGANQNTFDTNQFDVLAGHSNGFDAFNYAENVDNLQCQKCNPPLSKPRGKVRLCVDCKTETAQTAKKFFDNFQQYQRVHKLDRRCYGCEARKTSAMMSKIFPDICRRCADELKTKGTTAQNNFIARATNNFFKNLKRAVAI